MDLATILGLVIGIVLVIISICLGDAGIASLKGFLDAPSVLITFGGSFCAVLASNSLSEFIEGLKSIKLVFKVYAEDTGEMIRRIIDLSNVARKEGLLSLEEAAADLDDAFLKKGILLIVDGTDPELVRAIMETELMSLEERHKGKVAFWENLGAMGPAWGMIGTLIGLINMLGNFCTLHLPLLCLLCFYFFRQVIQVHPTLHFFFQRLLYCLFFSHQFAQFG